MDDEWKMNELRSKMDDLCAEVEALKRRLCAAIDVMDDIAVEAGMTSMQRQMLRQTIENAL